MFITRILRGLVGHVDAVRRYAGRSDASLHTATLHVLVCPHVRGGAVAPSKPLPLICAIVSLHELVRYSFKIRADKVAW